VIVVLPIVLDKWHTPTSTSDQEVHWMVTIVISLVCTVIGAVYGKVLGWRLPNKALTRRVLNAWAEAELQKRECERSQEDKREHPQGTLADQGRQPGSTQICREGGSTDSFGHPVHGRKPE
jgi:hypothetical protein